MNKKRKKILSVFAFICILIAIFAIYSFFPKTIKESIELQKNDKMISEYPNIVKQYAYFQQNSTIELYEYTDEASYMDTLIYIYFMGKNIDKNKLDSILKKLIVI